MKTMMQRKAPAAAKEQAVTDSKYSADHSNTIANVEEGGVLIDQACEKPESQMYDHPAVRPMASTCKNK